MTRVFSTALLAAVLAMAAGCDSDPAGLDPRDVEFAPELGIDLDAMIRTSSGLYYRDVEVGGGASAVPGRVVGLLYRGWLPDGTLFDARQTLNNPLTFLLGTGQVIRGWDEGVTGMRVGGTRTLVIPPNLGYGNQPTGPIPANSVLVFEVQLVSVTLP